MMTRLDENFDWLERSGWWVGARGSISTDENVLNGETFGRVKGEIRFVAVDTDGNDDAVCWEVKGTGTDKE
jgi:hypothetical protein